jgi:hypothetical protein
MFAIVSGGGHSGAAGHSTVPGRPPLAIGSFLTAACVSRGTTTDGRPSQSLLSILGVLRIPATPADTPSPKLEEALTRFPIGGSQVFVKYIRRARVTPTGTYYVYPVRATHCGQLPVSGESIVLSDVLKGCGPVPVGVTIGSVGGLSAAQIEAGHALEYGGGCFRSLDTSLVSGIVPDGVATVTLIYPAGRVGGYSHKTAPASSITADVVGNVVVMTVPRGGGNGRSWTTMTWGAANGTTIKTFP